MATKKPTKKAARKRAPRKRESANAEENETISAEELFLKSERLANTQPDNPNRVKVVIDEETNTIGIINLETCSDKVRAHVKTLFDQE
jgi:hypothetical protein